jgi:hypothetical protein
MPKHPAARFVQDKIPQGLVAGDPPALVPDRIAGRRQHPTDNDIAHLALGMGGHNVNGFDGPHG